MQGALTPGSVAVKITARRLIAVFPAGPAPTSANALGQGTEKPPRGFKMVDVGASLLIIRGCSIIHLPIPPGTHLPFPFVIMVFPIRTILRPATVLARRDIIQEVKRLISLYKTDNYRNSSTGTLHNNSSQ